MAQQTAVDWLITEIDVQFSHINIRWKEEMIDKAKEMEKEQIVKAYVEGINLVPCDVNSTDELDAEKYYNKTFGK